MYVTQGLDVSDGSRVGASRTIRRYMVLMLLNQEYAQVYTFHVFWVVKSLMRT